MIELKCSNCGSNDFIKDGKVYVCKYCHSKFVNSDEEEDLIEKYTRKAEKAFEKKDFYKMLEYAKKIQEIDPCDWYSWVMRLSYEVHTWSGRIGSLFMLEYGDNAIRYADEKSKKDARKYVYETYYMFQIGRFVRKEMYDDAFKMISSIPDDFIVNEYLLIDSFIMEIHDLSEKCDAAAEKVYPSASRVALDYDSFPDQLKARQTFEEYSTELKNKRENYEAYSRQLKERILTLQQMSRI